MATMPRGVARSVPDVAGEAYDEMLRRLRVMSDDPGDPLAIVSGEEGTDLLRGGAGEDRLASQRQIQPPRIVSKAPAQPHDSTGYYELGWEWMTGTGPRHHDFGQNDPATQILRQHEHIQRVRDQIARSSPKIGVGQHARYSLRGWEGVPEFAKDYAAVPTNGAQGNLAAAYLGSYDLGYAVEGVDPDGVATVDFAVKNKSSPGSAIRPPVIGYEPWYRTHVEPVINGLFSRGAGSATTQTLQWKERIPLQADAPGRH